jgi:hypothetical protein
MWVVVWIVLSILIGVMWSGKGRSFAGGLFLSLLLSPLVGFIAGLVIKTDIASVESSAINSGDFKKCPFCSELVKKEAVVCKHCGRDLQ